MRHHRTKPKSLGLIFMRIFDRVQSHLFCFRFQKECFLERMNADGVLLARRKSGGGKIIFFNFEREKNRFLAIFQVLFSKI